MNKIAQKWNFETSEYEPYELPKNASLFEEDLKTVIDCASCGEKLLFGQCYTSKQIHNNFGLGYGVCDSCYKKEFEQETSIREARINNV